MPRPRQVKTASLREQLRVRPGQRLRLTEALASATPGVQERKEAERALARSRQRLGELQYQLFADGRFGLLVVLQAMDAGGKDGTIRHVFSAFNPQGCTVTAFKAPSANELRHDFLWRIHNAVPRRGEVGVFNRSHYEDVLVVRVENLVPRAQWSARYEQINEFERLLTAERIHVVKFLLHISRDEQRERLQARLDRPEKLWKFDPADLEKRKAWNAYRRAFETMLQRCSTPAAPWYVIPANRKWYRNFAVAQVLRETLEELPLRWPKPAVDPRQIRIPR